MKARILPECCYQFNEMSYEDIKTAYSKQTTITGYVEEILTDKEEVMVKLGENMYGYIPFSEVTIYPLSYSHSSTRLYPVQIAILYHKNVRVKVSNITKERICLSRKQNMEEAYEHLKDCSTVYFHITSQTASMAFGDIGAGINGFLRIIDVCKARIRNISEYFHKHDMVWMSVLEVDDTKQFSLSYKNTFPPYSPKDFRTGDVYQGRIGEPVDRLHSGYYIDISPNVNGIMDANSMTPILRYGDKVECYISKSDAKGLKLKFLKKLN